MKHFSKTRSCNRSGNMRISGRITDRIKPVSHLQCISFLLQPPLTLKSLTCIIKFWSYDLDIPF